MATHRYTWLQAVQRSRTASFWWKLKEMPSKGPNFIAGGWSTCVVMGWLGVRLVKLPHPFSHNKSLRRVGNSVCFCISV